jgi:LmbE family N-acetylglucosaminyl deacetylase
MQLPGPPSAARGTLIVAPHCDDAAFALGGALAAGALTPVSVVVLFSRTNHTLHGPGAIDEVSRQRKAEEAAALGGRVRELAFLDLDDWSLERRAYARLAPAAEREAAAAIARVAERMPAATLLFPLAVGAHPDHVAAQALADLFDARWRVGFYEDMPYAARAHHHQVDTLPPGPVQAEVLPSDGRAKLAMLAHYVSQVQGGMLRAVAHYHEAVGGERIFWRTGHPQLDPLLPPLLP